MKPIDVLKLHGAAAASGGVSDVGPLLESVADAAMTLPAYAAGNVVIIHVHYTDAAGHAYTGAAPTGFTEIGRIAAFSNTVTTIGYRRVMDGSEGATVTVHGQGGGIGNFQARGFTITGVNTGGAITEGLTSASAQPAPIGVCNLVSAAVTTSGINRLVFNLWGTLRGTAGTMAESADSWTDLYMVATSPTPLSNQPHNAGTKLVAAASGVQATETRTESQTGSGDILMTVLSFAVIMA